MIKALLFICLLCTSHLCLAQTVKLPLNQASSKDKTGTDSSSKESEVIASQENKSLSDTSLTTLLARLEQRLLQLNKDIAILRRGFDTATISEELPEIEKSLEQLETTFERIGASANLRNMNSFKVILQQIQNRVKKHQEVLSEYSAVLLKIGENQANSASDSALRKAPSDSLLRLSYLEKIEPLLQKRKTADSLLSNYLKAIGLLQTRTSSSYFKAADLIDQLNINIKNFQSHFLRKDAPFIWQKSDVIMKRSLLSNIQLGFTRNLKISLYYIERNLGVIIFTLLLGGLFIFLNKMSVKKLQKSETLNWDQPLHFLKNKIWFPTLLVVFTMMPFILQNPPAGLVQFFWLLMLITATIIRWNDWPAEFRKKWIFIILFFFVYSIDSFLPEISYTGRWLLVALNMAALVLGWLMYRVVMQDKSRYHQLMDESILIFMIFNLLALGMNFFGRLGLARVFSNAGLMSITILLALQIIREILLEFVYLQVEAYKHSHLSGLLEFNKLKDRLRTTLGVGTIVIWLMALAWSMNLSDIIQEGIGSFLRQERKLGEFSFSFGNILVFVGIVWISSLLGKLVTFIFHGDDSKPVGGRKTKSGSLMLFTKLGIYTVGILLAFAATGIAMDKFAIIVGALGVGIGFGLQNIVNNLVSGVILAIEKPMEIGDVIELGTRTGTVKEIGFRSSKIATFEGSVIIVPNGDFISQQLINWTHSNNNYRRIDITVGVKYGSDLEKVKQIVEGIATGNPDVAKYPSPSILINDFAASSVSVRLLCWTADFDKWIGLKSNLIQEIYESFEKNEIEIPFNQTDLHIKSIDPKVADMLRGKEKGDNG